MDSWGVLRGCIAELSAQACAGACHRGRRHSRLGAVPASTPCRQRLPARAALLTTAAPGKLSCRSTGRRRQWLCCRWAPACPPSCTVQPMAPICVLPCRCMPDARRGHGSLRPCRLHVPWHQPIAEPEAGARLCAGNDLARVLNWGARASAFAGRPLTAVLHDIEHATVALLDRCSAPALPTTQPTRAACIRQARRVKARSSSCQARQAHQCQSPEQAGGTAGGQAQLLQALAVRRWNVEIREDAQPALRALPRPHKRQASAELKQPAVRLRCP